MVVWYHIGTDEVGRLREDERWCLVCSCPGEGNEARDRDEASEHFHIGNLAG